MESPEVKLMGSTRKIVVALIGFVVAMAVAGCTVPDTASGMPPITTADLRRMLGNPKKLKGIQYNREVGLAFQKRVLANLPGPLSLGSNTKRFESKEREARVGIKSVIPDGVAGASEGMPSPLPPVTITYPESTFIEVKAVNGVIRPDYGQYQILGMLDALSHSQAASSTGPRRAYPSLYFIVTGDTGISWEVEDEASKRNILVWLSFVAQTWSGRLQVTPPVCLNCWKVLKERQIAATLFGPTFSLPSLGSGAPAGQDQPILDDNLVGDPGTPGDTSPNP
ncbi:hypothetical protein [Polyangium aurulentum]|uniref:hypothetical protein n=1 Tax=Polyangium aurulentum TaxID=2567896 RepID=UPI0010AE881A|nr:hypothetical protein [Polyangium aurulentum]UQA55669.1 hypothetical protein E8A73_030575 [Polyangium aurulentum]